MASEAGRVFEVSKLRFAADGRVSAVWWTEVNAATNRDQTRGVEVPLADVLDAMHDGARVAAVFPAMAAHRPEREFVAVEHEDGSESVRLDGDASAGRELRDLPTLGD